MKPEFTVDYLKEILEYNQETGLFTRRKKIKQTNVGDVAGSICSLGYVIISIKNWPFKAHRLAWLYVYGKWPSNCIDHINGNRADNRIENLRDVSRTINQHNITQIGSKNKTGLMGVRVKNGKFEAQITLAKKSIYLGRFDDAEQAHKSYLEAKKSLHFGKDAR